MNTFELPSGYTLRSVKKVEYDAAFEKLYKEIFANTVLYHYLSDLSEEEKANRIRHEKVFSKLPAYPFLIEKDGEAVGWHNSFPTDAQTLNMSYSGLLPAHRRKGLYSAVVPRILELGRREGYQRVTSKHAATNNAVLIPKMKAGFLISGFELSEKYGVLVTLVYHFNENRRKALEFRAGQRRLTSELASKITLLEG